MHKIILPAVLFFLCSCGEQNTTEIKDETSSLNRIAENYVRLGLDIGRYDQRFVDAYYGPDSLKPTGAIAAVFPKDSFLTAVTALHNQLKAFDNSSNDTLAKRSAWIQSQLKAFESRLKLLGGDSASFDDECKQMYGVTVPVHDSLHFQNIIRQLDKLLPGKGNVNDRFQQLANHFIIPKNKLDTVIQAAIAECRKKTQQHFQLPATESYTLEFVNNKFWGGYNWYKGNYKSVIQINTDLDIFIDRVIDVGSHESYPGHHIYNMMLEKNLYQDKGWTEISLYPLFSPQSLIAEGSANYGIELAFPGDEKTNFAKQVLLPLAGLDTTGISIYFKALALKDELNYARNEAARGLLNKTMTETQAMVWMKDYCMMNDKAADKFIRFILADRSYLINYNLGKDLVKKYVVSKAGADINKQWEVFGWLLSNPVTPGDLTK